MNKRDRLKIIAGWVWSFAISVLFLQAEDSEKGRKLLHMLGEFMMKIAIGIVTFAATAMGGWNGAAEALCYIMAFDYLSGFAVAGAGKSKKTKNGRLSSAAGFKGLIKKALIMGVVALAHLLDKGTGQTANTWRDITCYCYMANEFLSIIENLGLLGIWIPPPLVKMLEVMQNKGIVPKAPVDEQDKNKTNGEGKGIG